MEQLSPEDRSEARQLFESGGGGGRVCSFCGGIHMRACPRVAEFELYDSGEVRRVKFWAEGQWSGDYIIWPEMAFDEGEEEGDVNG